MYQKSGNELWSAPENLGSPGSFASYDIKQMFDGRYAVFVKDGTDSIWTMYNSLDDEITWGDFMKLGKPNVEQNYVSQNFVVGQDEGGWLELFYCINGDVWHMWQTPLKLDDNRMVSKIGWSAWTLMPQTGNIRRISIGQSVDGRLQLFGIKGDGTNKGFSGAPYTIYQTLANNGWAAEWESLGGHSASDVDFLTPFQEADGKINVYFTLNDKTLGSKTTTYIQESSIPDRSSWFENQVRKHAPIVYFAAKEQYFPCSMEWYLDAETSYLDADGNNKGKLTPDLLSFLGPTAGKGGSIAYNWNNNSVKKGQLDSAPSYVHILPAMDWSGGYDIQYWFLSSFNGEGVIKGGLTFLGKNYEVDIPVPPIGQHQGDLEYVMVRIDKDGNQKSMFYSIHDYGQWTDAPGTPGAREVYSLKDGHPEVYAAFNGHPSFWKQGDFITKKDGKAIGIDINLQLMNKLGELILKGLEKGMKEVEKVEKEYGGKLADAVNKGWNESEGWVKGTAGETKKAFDKAGNKIKDSLEDAGDKVIDGLTSL